LGAVGIKDTVAAADGREVMRLIQRQPFDLLMLDWHMPGRSGLEVVRAVRGRGGEMPIVMVSAEAARDQIVEALRAGASDYILKPFDAKTLWSKLEKYRNAGSASAAAKSTKIPAATPT
jgi:two-component system chemotaxis response regulator CheY